MIPRLSVKAFQSFGKKVVDASKALWRDPHRLRHVELALAAIADRLTREERAVLEARSRAYGAQPHPPHRDKLLGSELCRGESFSEPYFMYWTSACALTPRYHRKLWEFTFICQALYERGLFTEGKKGLGFGVGQEPLPSLFAKLGCFITGTDIAPSSGALLGWTDSGEHAADKWQMYNAAICGRARFEEHVTYRAVDMTAIPSDLRGFDFCWSACALEHLGTIEAGLAFVEASIDCLAPGGVAVHTTELNTSSNDETAYTGRTVLFRRRDFEALEKRLRARGCSVAPLDFTPGRMAVDEYIDLPPYRVDPHVRIALAGYVTTSFGLIVRKG